MPSSNGSLNPEQQDRLVQLAWDSIRHGLQHGRSLPVALETLPPALQALCATFVTLEHHGALRGCIGRLEAGRPLAVDVAENAFAAAFQDPRFPPLREAELDGLSLHLSLLTPAEPIQFQSEQDLLAQLQPGVDGLILAEGYRRGTFLPSVWEQLPRPEDFLDHLKLKAGLPSGYWSDTLAVWRYRTEVIG